MAQVEVGKAWWYKALVLLGVLPISFVVGRNWFRLMWQIAASIGDLRLATGALYAAVTLVKRNVLKSSDEEALIQQHQEHRRRLDLTLQEHRQAWQQLSHHLLLNVLGERSVVVAGVGMV